VSSEASITASGRRQSTQWALAIGLICLSLAVFNWGLQYKMSLYHQSPNGIVHAPAAKLWMGKDGGSAQSAQAPPLEPAPLLMPVTLFITFLALYFALSKACIVRMLFYRQRCPHFLRMRLAPFRTSFFFRPPPVNA
jgi:hypothetical protein